MPTRSWAPRVRLALLVLVLAGGPVAVAVTDVIDAGTFRRTVDAAGAWAPLAYVVLSALLGALLVPGPLLAGAGGLLFGAAVGTAVTVSSSVLSALVAWRVGRLVGRDGVQDLAGARADALEGLLGRRGLAVVIGQRIVPGIPDAPASYLAGALGLRAWQIALGTAIGVLPRAFAYSAFGASLDDPRSPLALAGVAAWVLAAALGVEVARRSLRAARASRRPKDPD